MTGAQMVTAVLEQGGFDVSQSPRPMVLGWLQEIVDELVARAKWRRASVPVVSVAGQGQYSVGVAVEVDEITVGGATASRVSTEQLAKIKAGELTLASGHIVFAPYYNTAGSDEGVELYPAPSSSGLAISMASAVIATTLVDDSSAVTVLPADLHGRVVDEAIRLGRRRLFGVEYDSESTRGVMVQGLVERRNSRLGGGTGQLVVLRRRRG